MLDSAGKVVWSEINPDCMRVKKIDQLYGLQIYCHIAMNANDLLVSEKAMRRLIEYHLRPLISTKMYMSLISSSSNS